MTEDPRIEAVARALAEYDGQNPDAGVPNIDLTADPLWLRYEPRAHAALAAADAAAWRPFEDAPENGEPVLLHGKCELPSIDAGKEITVKACWTDHNGGGWVWYGPVAVEFTHFMPLPTPPQEQE